MGSFTTIPRSVAKGPGGIDYVLICNFNDVSTSWDDASAGFVHFTDSSNAYWTKFTPLKESSGWSDTPSESAPTANLFYNPRVTMTFGRNSTILRNNMKQIGQSELIAVVQEKGNIAVVLGAFYGLDMEDSPIGSGAAPGDPNNMVINLMGKEDEPYGLIDASMLTQITP